VGTGYSPAQTLSDGQHLCPRPFGVLGLSAFYHDNAACLLRNGDIVAGAQERRFTRVKGDAGRGFGLEHHESHAACGRWLDCGCGSGSGDYVVTLPQASVEAFRVEYLAGKVARAVALGIPEDRSSERTSRTPANSPNLLLHFSLADCL
jgi:hypothetical protein